MGRMSELAYEQQQEQAMRDLENADEHHFFAEVFQARQETAEQVAKRIEKGTATKADADWIRREFGIEQ